MLHSKTQFRTLVWMCKTNWLLFCPVFAAKKISSFTAKAKLRASCSVAVLGQCCARNGYRWTKGLVDAQMACAPNTLAPLLSQASYESPCWSSNPPCRPWYLLDHRTSCTLRNPLWPFAPSHSRRRIRSAHRRQRSCTWTSRHQWPWGRTPEKQKTRTGCSFHSHWKSWKPRRWMWKTWISFPLLCLLQSCSLFISSWHEINHTKAELS